jgi:hypothetical protein
MAILALPRAADAQETAAAPADVDASPSERLRRVLVEDGFANVQVAAGGGRVVAAYENTRYRDPRRGMHRVAELLREEAGAEPQLVLVPTVGAVPLLTAKFAAGPGDTHPVAVSMDVAAANAELRGARRGGSSFGRVDVAIHPWLEASFGDYDNPVASRTGVAPEARVALRPGLTVAAQALFTLQDDLPTGESRVRPGRVTVNQLARLPDNVLVSATAGAFTGNRYGADIEAAMYLANGRLSVGGELGLTSALSYGSEQWLYSTRSATTALLSAAIRLPMHGLEIRAAGGAFLGPDRGVRLDLLRRFGELELGWFAVATRDGENGGVSLRLPLPQTRYPRPGPVRVRAAESFPWQYRYLGPVSSGRAYDTGNRLPALPLRVLLGEAPGS